MKKIVIALMIIMITGCSASGLSWSDVENSYVEMDGAINDPAISGEFLKSDYISIIEDIKTALDGFSSGIKEDRSQADRLWEDAVKLQKAVEATDAASPLMVLANDLKQLIKAAYDKSESFTSIKENVITAIDEILAWDDMQWASVERHPLLGWEDAKELLEAAAAEALETMTPKKKVTESEIEGYKDTILDSYAAIEKGVDRSSLDSAAKIWAAASVLEEYTDEVEGRAPEMVNSFARQTLMYVREKLGETIDDPDYDFPLQIETARKWTLSTLNELTTSLKK